MSSRCKFCSRTARMLWLAGLTVSLVPFASAQAETSRSAQSAITDNPMHLAPTNMVTMVVADVDRETEWYVTVLGFHELAEPGTSASDPNAVDTVRKIELDGFRLHLVQHKGSTRPVVKAAYSNELQGYDHISFQTRAIDESYKWLTAHAVTNMDITRDKKTNGLRTLKFHDPEGNEIHIELPD